ncbi:midasin-like [Gigantopelta aegis]|uniref:midasin-like n=1 Tax=Gigantopelta aegis TaxID=1735272 RepID=UPI001B88B862|nr:midasin-like [Gigantopelta aegis]
MDMEKSTTTWTIFESLNLLCQTNGTCNAKLKLYLSKQIWSPSDRSNLMNSLCDLFINQKCTEDICRHFQPVILDVAERAKTAILKQGDRLVYKRFAVALSRGLHVSPDVQRFAVEFLKTYKPFHTKDPSSDGQPEKKKMKRNKISDKDVCEAIWRYVYYAEDDVCDYITLEHVVHFLSSKDQVVRWCAANTVSKILKMSADQKQKLFRKYFTTAEKTDLSVRFFFEEEGRKILSHLSADLVAKEMSPSQTHTMQAIMDTDFSSSVVEVAGILIPKFNSGQADNMPSTGCLIPVASMLNNLRSLALAVVSGNSVLLQGPVGSGKTSLVEHLGQVTGRSKSPDLLKIQLGDQTDSKTLLGIYRCTEVPGQFVWQPGILTRAITEGHWILLEDIDHAPMDVVSILLPLLENGCLSVPGHGDNVRAHSGFRLFATQRLIGGSGCWYNQHSSSSVLLDKMWTKINVEPLSRPELQIVISTKFPLLTTVVDKLLDIYFLLSAGKHDVVANGNMSPSTDTAGKFLSHDGRLVSTRDLMTWCSRISADFDVSSSESGLRVFQEAVDCFVASLPKVNKRTPLAEAIGAKLNINKIQAEYFCSKHKPNIDITPSTFTVGRVALQRKPVDIIKLKRLSQCTFAFTRQSVSLLEKVTVCVARNEPALLVGETGTGKTSSVQFLAHQLGHNLHVINMNQQSDSTDLLGGFKPVDLKFVIMPFREDFEMLFCKTFSRKQNSKFLGHIQDCFLKKRWNDLLTLMDHTQRSACVKYKEDPDTLKEWQQMGHRLHQLRVQVRQIENALAFAFIEGTLVTALKKGDWVLLDEINLAAAETLECLSGLLESTTGSVVLTERGDMEPIVRHADFRLFACMNPATDVGKKDLTLGIRNRFTELFVDELDDTQDLKILVNDYLKGLALAPTHIDGIVRFYLKVRMEAEKHLTDGTGHRPHFSLRTLCRALKFAAPNPCGLVARSLYEGFCLSFLTQLDRSSHPVVKRLICELVIGKSNIKSILKHPIPAPSGGKYLSFEGYWISQGSLEPTVPDDYILTPSVRDNLRDLARIVSAGQHPVLIQGETSVGKTSLITWLSKASGNRCVRVNNHEHTDLQEYIGCYAADASGKLVFKEGVLVEAMRQGFWIILDELNLAPSDVLEALNRLLDDNRELFIPETQETVKAHPKFMLFATQNPPGQYGGRKMLSRAFRNRFIELHFDELPSGELETILHQRCSIPMSYAKRLVAAMLDLQTRRRGSGVFAGKQGFMTLRDLFRWAERYRATGAQTSNKFYDWDQHLADHGYMLLAGRVRKPEEAAVIQEVIKRHLKRAVSPETLFDLFAKTSPTTVAMLKDVVGQSVEGFQHVVWTHSMRRLAVLIGQAIKFQEPVLLVGETGCGKTTVCQLYAAINQHQLYSVNCHLHTESADFLGGLRPVRDHADNESEKDHKLFEWVDGPLVTAMKDGEMFLIDEISLADDSVLERLNSVLEPERRLLLAEKGGGDGNQNEVEHVVAKEGFQVFATMNPGGDFGKKELSPALRNRFTEIWCPPTNQRQDLIEIIEHNLKDGICLSNQQDGTSGFGTAMMGFIDWFRNNEIGKRITVSIRDILSWVQFINTCSRRQTTDVVMETEDTADLDPVIAYIHGACLVFLDSLGTGNTQRGEDFSAELARRTCLDFLLEQVNQFTGHKFSLADLQLTHQTEAAGKMAIVNTDHVFSIPPFTIEKGDQSDNTEEKYALQAPTTCVNAQRILRALQLPKPLLLEGSPGVGKTSLVTAIAKAAQRQLVRINLSEQTDVTDLFGADLPVEGGEGGMFAWRDGPLLQALKSGHWIVLDELNLASQSVLEGLNACLDHRGEVYIPELGRTFHIQHNKTRLFACQNPLNQGGGRKGLPRSFLNRFTQVYVEPLSRADLLFIAETMYPRIPSDLLAKMVDFNMMMYDQTAVKFLLGRRGGPWEFNLRDLFRWCDLLLANQKAEHLNPGDYVSLIYENRMRTTQDKKQVLDLYTSHFDSKYPVYCGSGFVHIGNNHVQAGHSFLPRGQPEVKAARSRSLQILHQQLKPLESVMKCVEMKWMTILVGPQSSGKTSLVSLLAELTGTTLHVLPMNSSMDTTELLGGFEQSDVFRHVEEMAVEIGAEIRHCQRVLLTQGDVSTSGLILALEKEWNTYRQLRDDRMARTAVEEFDFLKVKVRSLNAVMELLQKISRQHRISSGDKLQLVSLKLKTLFNNLIGSQSNNGAGTFEWVDSLLVKALEVGHWLLIDNVNFCSASVLDRLNALLEPNGVLSINERGVMDGEIITIKAHPNFRLFLAMDPKFGEISRAMRNRGVEIYIPGEDDGCPYSDFDVKTMLKDLGLNSKPACDWLIGLHQEMKVRLPHSDQPMIVDLLCAAVMTVQQVERGVSFADSLYHAANDIYVRSLKNFISKGTAKEILTESLGKLKDETFKMADSSIDLGLWPVCLPGSAEYMDDVTLASVRFQSGVLTFLIDRVLQTQQHHTASDNSMETNIHEDSTSLSVNVGHLRTAVDIFVSLVPEKDFKFASHWFRTFMEQNCRDTKLVSKGVEGQVWSLEAMLKCLPQLVTDSLNRLADHTEMKKQRQVWQTSCGDCELAHILVSDQPWDIGWNPQLVDRIGFLCQDTEENTYDAIVSTIHRLYVFHTLNITSMMYRPLKERLEENCVRAQSSHSVQSKVLVHLFNMVTELEAAIPDLVETLDGLTEQNLFKIWDAVHWLPRMLHVTKLWREIPKMVFLSQITLHWNWFEKKFLQQFLRQNSSCVSTKLHSVVVQLQNLLGQDNMAAKCFEKFWAAWGHPPAFLSESEFELSQSVQELVQALNVYDDSPLLTVREKVRVATLKSELRRDVMVLVEADELLKENVKDTSEKLKSAGILKKYDDSIEPDSQTLTPEISVDLEPNSPFIHVDLWPVFEHICILAELSMLPSIWKDCPVSASHITDFSKQFTPEIACQFIVSKADQLKQVSVVRKVMKRLWSCAATRNTDRWLTWYSDLEEEAPVANKIRGPEMLLLAPVSHMMFFLLSHDQNEKQTDILPLRVPLADFQRQLNKLSLVSSHLWTHASTLAASEYSIRNLQQEYLVSSFIHLLDSLTCLLHVETKTQWTTIINRLKSQFDSHILSKETLMEAHSIAVQAASASLSEAVVAVLARCFEVMEDIVGLRDNVSVVDVGHALVYVGLAHALLLSPVGPVDPVEKKMIKLRHVTDELLEIECELAVRDLHQRMMTGESLFEIGCSHPRVRYLLARRDQLTVHKERLQKEKVYRPDLSQYCRLTQDVGNYLQTVGSVQSVTGLLSKLILTNRMLHEMRCDPVETANAVQEERVWQRTQHKFLERLEDVYPCYVDILEPFVVAVYQISLGMRVIAQNVDSALKTHQLNFGHSPEHLITKLTKFPVICQTVPSILQLANDLTSEPTLQMMKKLTTTHLTEYAISGEKQILSKLFIVALLLIKNHSILSRELTFEVTFALSRVFDLFVSIWSEQEERKRQKEIEDESLYRYKDQVHGDERSEQEIQDDEFKSSFPTFEKDFSDVAGPKGLEDSNTELPTEGDSLSVELPEVITLVEMREIHKTHHQVFTQMTSTDWIAKVKPSQCLSRGHVNPALMSYSVAATLGKLSHGCLDSSIDSHLLGGHLLISGSVQSTVHQSLEIEADIDSSKDDPLRKIPTEYYDVYRDPNISEVVQCRPVLDRFCVRVSELQSEWPDHPTLKQLQLIVKRIMSFSVTSPVMRFLTGLELLLEKSQDWEANAASHVSMTTQLTELTSLIIQWRKLELSCWHRSLDTEVEKSQQSVCHWWFHFYQLIGSFVSPDQQKQGNESSEVELMNALKNFLESSALGEFSARLKLVFAFHCQAVHMNPSERQVAVVNMLWNVHQFYKCFLPSVEDEITRLRSPIEKELKGFVKIARWNDMNYWALKQTTEKTHKTVHKHTKNFQAILKRSVKGLLVEKGDNFIPSPETTDTFCEKFNDFQTQCERCVQNKQSAIVQFDIPASLTSTSSLQTKLSQLTVRCAKHWKKLLTVVEYTGLVVSLDEFTGEIIEGAHELQSTNVTPDLEKAKQKAEAKLLNVRKRKALADLFKHLTIIGLSYRKGLALCAKDKHFDPLHSPPLDIEAALCNMQQMSDLPSLWDGCAAYFFKCIARKAQFSIALQSASKELGVGNIDRCRGFTEHLMTMLMSQHTELTTFFNHYTKLSKLSSEVDRFNSENPSLPPQNQLTQCLFETKSLTVQLLEGLQQFVILLHSCPSRPDASRPYPSPFPPEKLSAMSLVCKGDDSWNHCLEVTKQLIVMAEEEQMKLLEITDQLHDWNDFRILKNCLKSFENFVPELNKMSVLFNHPHKNSPCCLNETLLYLSGEISKHIENFSSWSDELSEDRDTPLDLVGERVTEFSSSIDDVIAAMLLGVQNLVMHHAKDSCSVLEAEKSKDVTNEDADMKKGHLSVFLIDGLNTDVQNLQLSKVTKIMESLLTSLSTMRDSQSDTAGLQESSICIKLLLRCYPMLHQYMKVVEFFAGQMIGVYRVSGKLLSVLLGLFTELASKGFCLPAEFSDEMSEGGATDFVDIEGGGMGEGEGVTDVSDQIETEDQLDDAHKEGEEKKEEQDNSDSHVPPEDKAIEMSEDFDGKVDDLETAEGDEDSDDDDNKEEDELDKQMGDVDQKDMDKLDEQLWGSDEEDTLENEESKDESGPGAGQQTESELVAKDDNKDKSEAEDQQTSEKDEKNKDEEEDHENQTPHELDEVNEDEYDENHVDPYHGKQEPEKEPESLDLPDDLNLDDDEKAEGQEGEMETEEQEAQADAETKEDSEIPKDMGEEKDENKDEGMNEDEKPEDGDGDDDKDDDKEGGKEEVIDRLKEEDEEPSNQQEEDKQDSGENDPGFSPQDEMEQEEPDQDPNMTEDPALGAEDHGKTHHDTENVEISELAQDSTATGETEQKETDGTGVSAADTVDGHEGQTSLQIADNAATSQENRTQHKRRPGRSDDDRSLGSTEQKYKKLKTIDRSSQMDDDNPDESDKPNTDLYEHVKDSTSHHDAQTLDVATDEQQAQQPVPNKNMEEEGEPVDEEDDVLMDEQDDNDENNHHVEQLDASKGKLRDETHRGEQSEGEDNMDEGEDGKTDIPGERVTTTTVERGPESSIHTVLDHLHLDTAGSELDVDKLRAELEENVMIWSHQEGATPEALAAASDAWQQYDAITAGLAQDLCEQLRLILEPSQATKLKGDYRTGKRLNMRKVIPYIASQFRKDKIWLRRTKPSKRQYQIMMAIDDSSSMVDNHSKQLAFESLALISNALTLLESGELAICSFGESVRMLHPFTDQFTNQSGASILQHFTFEQKKTKIAQLLKQATSIMVDARRRQHGSVGHPETSQLLLIVSDGRGLFMEGMDVVKTAVRQAREANIFLVFVILDNPQNKDSVMDIRVPVFKGSGQLPEIKSYMEHFPFPFYIILRDINSLPYILSDALRQWFELVTAGDR